MTKKEKEEVRNFLAEHINNFLTKMIDLRTEILPTSTEEEVTRYTRDITLLKEIREQTSWAINEITK